MRNRYMFRMAAMRARGEHQPGDVGSPSSRWVKEVRRIVLRALREYDAAVFLFGSWARGDATACSDIDVAIEPHSSLPPGLLADLREGLEESHVPYRVDIVDLSDAAPTLRRRILEEGIRWRG
jgi:predicted nucleotidyltransferase